MADECGRFDPNQVNSFILEKQYLTCDPRKENIPTITRDICGLHATSATTPYLCLLARMNTFAREDLEEELYRKKTLARIRYARNTFYILPKENLPVAFAAVRRRAHRAAERYLEHFLMRPAAYENLVRKILDLLQGEGLAIAEIKKELGPVSHLSSILNLMCFQGLLICGKPKGTWKSNLHTYHSLSEYYPDLDLGLYTEEEAQQRIILSYIETFGPVTEMDTAWWTGFSKGSIKKALEKHSAGLVQIQIAGSEKKYHLCSSQLDGLLSTEPQSGEPVNFLPFLDPYLMGYRERERFLGDGFFHNVYDRSGNATPTILCEGKIVGVWDVDRSRVKYFLFLCVGNDIRSQIRTQASKIGRFFFGVEPEIEECRKMLPLTERTAGGFMSPLRKPD